MMATPYSFSLIRLRNQQKIVTVAFDGDGKNVVFQDFKRAVADGNGHHDDLPVLLHRRKRTRSGIEKPQIYGIIKTDEAGTLDFSGVPAFLVTNAFIVQCSAAKMFNIVSGPQLLSIHQGFCDYRPGFPCPWTHGP